MNAQLAAEVALPDAPTVPGLPLIGNAVPFMMAHGIPVDYMRDSAAKHGDVVRFQLGKQSIYLVSHPDLVHEVLVKRVSEFHKPNLTGSKPFGLARFLGDGILTGDHEVWRPQRKLVQPLMHTKHIASYGDTMARFGEQLLASWQDGSVRDIHADMTQVTMWIIAETMFGMKVNQSPDIEKAAHDAQVITIADITSPIPAWLTGRNRHAEQVNEFLTALVQRFMEERRAQGEVERYDLLSLLMETRDEDGQPMSDEFVRDNILTLFFAGHETTANTLTWAFYFLDQHPEVMAKLQAEVDSVLDGRLPTLADLPQLPYTMMVIKETMRVEPTVSAFPRLIVDDLELGGYRLRAGSIVMLPPYVLHHDARWWSQPDVFDPTRFDAHNEPNIPKYAYLPFGGGPRVCIGNHFALMEAQILLAVIVSHYNVRLAPGTQVQPVRNITSSPKTSLNMIVERRK
jgi:cytochrome P450